MEPGFILFDSRTLDGTACWPSFLTEITGCLTEAKYHFSSTKTTCERLTHVTKNVVKRQPCRWSRPKRSAVNRRTPTNEPALNSKFHVPVSGDTWSNWCLIHQSLSYYYYYQQNNEASIRSRRSNWNRSWHLQETCTRNLSGTVWTTEC